MHLFLYASVSFSLLANLASAQRVAKTYPGDAGYPSKQQWDLLNKTVDGNLLDSRLPAAACYPPILNQAACTEAAQLASNEAQVPSDPTLIQSPWWSGDKCLASFSTNGTCALGNYPVYVVAAKNTQHVSAGVQFANLHNLRLSVENTGHDFLGRNLGAGGLSIWTYGLQGIEFNDDWTPSALPAEYSQRSRTKRASAGVTVVTYGASTMFQQIFDAVSNRSVTIVTGADKTVGAGGGWVQSGGHGYLTNMYGMGVDNVLEHEVVTPTGDIVIANANSHPDLFYALRGGGGGTFGITTRTTVKTHPKPSYGAAGIVITPGNLTTDAWLGTMAYWFSAAGNFTDFGLTGYPIFASIIFTGTFVAPSKTNDEVQQFLAPLVAGMKARGATISASPVNITDIAQVSAGYSSSGGGSTSIGPSNVIFGSRLLTREGLQNQTAVQAASKQIFAKGYIILPYANLGGQVAKNANLNVALNPAWRKATMHFIYVNEGPATIAGAGQAAIRQAHQDIITDINPYVDPLSADSGAYLNEANYKEPDPQTTFWGGTDRYKILLAIKKKYDPFSTLWCSPCIGQEAFKLGADGKLYYP